MMEINYDVPPPPPPPNLMQKAAGQSTRTDSEPRGGKNKRPPPPPSVGGGGPPSLCSLWIIHSAAVGKQTIDGRGRLPACQLQAAESKRGRRPL